ncbi:MAG TPA: DmsC/YnfH family molybdoenzyme membrane anchor subunit [Xanthomonadales bacterium]|nr:DmsC/YnfH family molybdoenzyme membrane anchor subunit [Xanthomonadales bacterium]
MFNVRSDEPKYAFLWDKETREKNRYGKNIELTQDGHELHGESLNINDDAGIGDNPNRYKQHGFFFNADNCIGCHACESACSEKNDNPAHLSFRSVGFVEGGTYPAYQRLNISMACNHCDDPVCLKGCPTRAYTKFAEYGAVLQDPDICFGCGYCTWVCPYNAPQLDPVKGQVSKCNMCVDRLEVGLKPACVSACLGNALDFGVVENTPENRTQCKTEIPGFPTPEITNPNIRFQQTRSTHREMTRTDAVPVKYHRDDAAAKFEPHLDPKQGQTKHWNWKKLLGSHESSHVIFTLTTQAVMGAFYLLALAALLAWEPLSSIPTSSVGLPLLATMFVLLSFGMFKLNMHLGKPHRFYRGFNNLRYSPVSREILGVTLFLVFFVAYVLTTLLGWTLLATASMTLAVIGGLGGLYFMYRIYRIKARPYWDHWQTATAFGGNTLSLGALLMGAVCAPIFAANDQAFGPLLNSLLPVVVIGLAIEIIGHWFHGRDLKALNNEGTASWYQQATKYGKSWVLRNVLLGTSLLLAAAMSTSALDADSSLLGWGLLSVLTLASAIISRSLFFVLVIPTTMPGAFFWKNQSFQEHAKETGLSEMEQMGVVKERHGEFKMDELLDTIKNTTPRQILGNIRDILTWKSVG